MKKKPWLIVLVIFAVVALFSIFQIVSKSGIPDVTGAHKAEIIYRDKWGTESICLVELGNEDRAAVTQILSRISKSRGGNCGFGHVEIKIYTGLRAISYFPAGDGDPHVAIDDPNGNRFGYIMISGDIKILHEIVYRNYPNPPDFPESFGEYLKTLSERNSDE